MVEDVVLFERVGSVGLVTINRAEQKNALSNAVLAGLRQGIATAKADPAVRVMVLRGAGNEAFCAGGDLREMKEGSVDAFDAHNGRSQLAHVFRDLWNLGKPTIARVPGFALAGGFGLAVACDFVVASDRAVFGVPEVNIGLWGYMITVPLLHWMQPKHVLNLMLTGRRVKANEALALGFVTTVVPHDELDAALEKLADSLLAAAPQSVALGRTAFYTVANHDVDLRLRMLEAMLSVNLAMPNALEGLAAFAEKRPAAWRAS